MDEHIRRGEIVSDAIARKLPFEPDLRRDAAFPGALLQGGALVTGAADDERYLGASERRERVDDRLEPFPALQAAHGQHHRA